eukprot:7129003-Heterocapsa_arctica.AAC.1
MEADKSINKAISFTTEKENIELTQEHFDIAPDELMKEHFEHLEQALVADKGASMEADKWADCKIDEPDTRWQGGNGDAVVEYFDITADELAQEHLEPHLPDDTDHSTVAQPPGHRKAKGKNKGKNGKGVINIEKHKGGSDHRNEGSQELRAAIEKLRDLQTSSKDMDTWQQNVALYLCRMLDEDD